MKMRMTRDQMNHQVPAKVERLDALQQREIQPDLEFYHYSLVAMDSWLGSGKGTAVFRVCGGFLVQLNS